MKHLFAAVLIVALGAGSAFADEIQLTNGRRITGQVTKKDSQKIVVEVGAGTIVLDAKDVSSINPGSTPLSDYDAKWNAIKSSTRASDYYDLVKWCKDNKVTRYVTPLCLKVIELEPDHAGARADLHHEKIGGKWLTFEQAQEARGLVYREDRWMTQAEVQMIERRRLEAQARAEAAKAERERRREEERAYHQAAIDDYNARLANAMNHMDGYFYSPSFAWTTPYYRPYWWAPYERSRNYYQHGWEYGWGGGAVPVFDIGRLFRR